MAGIVKHPQFGVAMATQHLRTESRTSMSEEAYELIQCFYDGVDVVVRELAEQIAQERGSFLENEETTIAIEVEDVKEAGKRVIDALTALIKDKPISDELKNSIQSMQGCFNHHVP